MANWRSARTPGVYVARSKRKGTDTETAPTQARRSPSRTGGAGVCVCVLARRSLAPRARSRRDVAWAPNFGEASASVVPPKYLADLVGE